MPATVTYLSVTPTDAVPVRVFIHRKHVLAESQVAVNEKSMLTLSATASLRLGNDDLNALSGDLRQMLAQLLLDEPLAELFPKRSVGRSTVLVRVLANAWKCKLVVTLGYIVDLRYALASEFSGTDVEFLARHGVEPQVSGTNRSRLLERHFSFSFSENEDDSLLSLDDKKQVRYSMARRRLLNNKLTDPLVLYVLSRPRTER